MYLKSFGKPFRSCFQKILSYHREVFLKLRIFYDRNKLFDIIIDRLSHCFQDIGRQTQASSGKHRTIRLQVYIISTMIGLLSFGIDITSEMYFIRCFIRREAGIPVNTISTVFGLNPRIVSSNREIRAITVAKKLSNSARAVSYSALCSLNHSRLLFAERSFKN